MSKYCPMKYGLLNNLEKITTEENIDDMSRLMECDKNECAWYCDYGECAILSLPSLYNVISQVSTDIRQNKGELMC